MPVIEVSIITKQDKAKVYELLTKMDQFPQFMRDVKRLTLVKQESNKYITSWQVDIDGLLLNWQEIDTFDKNHFIIDFQLVKGDYRGYKGRWQLRSIGPFTRISLKAELDWGIPVLEKYVNNTLTKKAKLGFLGMLKAIKKRLENKNE